MVASGLTQRVEVSQYRLAAHLVLALVIFAAIVWTLRRMSERPPIGGVGAAEDHERGAAGADLPAALFRRAGRGPARRHASTTPGPTSTARSFRQPARLFFEEPWWRNLFDNTLTVQFEHRMTAYALLALALWHALDAVRLRAAHGRDPRRMVAGGCDHAAGGARYPHAAQPGADRSRAGAPGGRDGGADAGGASGRTACRAAGKAGGEGFSVSRSDRPASNSRRRRRHRAGATNS